LDRKFFYRNFVQFFKFGVVGLSNTAISYLIYLLLVYLGLHYIVANVAAFVISVLNSFFWNHKFVFKDETGGKRDIRRALIRTYASYAFSGLIVSNILLYVFIELFGVREYIAPLLGLVVTVPLNYILNRQWAFKPVKGNEER
jgi:putative flippase GtrA